MTLRILPAALLAAALGAPAFAQEGGTKTVPANVPKDVVKDAEEAKPVVLAVGSTVAADVALTDLDGKEFKFGDLRGKTVVIHFWSITCPWEKVAEPKLQQIATDYKDKDVVVLAINANANEIGAKPAAADFQTEDAKAKPYASVRKHMAKVEFNHKVLVDHSGDVGRLFAAKTTPHCFVLNGEGKIAYSGALDNDGKGELGDKAQHYVRLAVDAVKAGKEVETSSTRAYG